MKVVITGTSRGIGLELAQIALGAGHDVMALARQPEKSKGLMKLKGDFKDKLTIVHADLTEPDAAQRVAAMARDWGSVDILINNAGVLRQGTKRQDFMESFLVNSIGPFEMTEALLPLLKKSQQPRVVHITSLMGSIADNGSGGYYAYRSSKAALNMINKSLSKDQPWLATLVVHPGWVKTDMGGEQAPTSVTESAQGIWKAVENLTTAKSGQFYDYKGKALSW